MYSLNTQTPVTKTLNYNTWLKSGKHQNRDNDLRQIPGETMSYSSQETKEHQVPKSWILKNKSASSKTEDNLPVSYNAWLYSQGQQNPKTVLWQHQADFTSSKIIQEHQVPESWFAKH